MSRFRNAALALLVVGLGVLAFQAPPAGATVSTGPSATPPRIVAHPDSVMVNSKTLLTGTGFAPHTTLTVVECSAKTWLAPRYPCDTKNRIHVHVTSAGTFVHPMTALLCPPIGPSAVEAGFAEQCYVGVVHPFGIDEIRLVGAGSLVVTGP